MSGEGSVVAVEVVVVSSTLVVEVGGVELLVTTGDVLETPAAVAEETDSEVAHALAATPSTTNTTSDLIIIPCKTSTSRRKFVQRGSADSARPTIPEEQPSGEAATRAEHIASRLGTACAVRMTGKALQHMVVPRADVLFRVTCQVMSGDGFDRDSPDDSPVVAAREPFDAFFRREYRSVLGLALVLCRQRGVAEELTMDGFEAALRNWETVSALDNPGAWVRKVVSNASVSRYRRLAAEARARLRLSGDSSGSVTELGDSAIVWEAVRRLPRRQAQTVALFYVEGYNRREIAELLGISDESVKTHLDRARRKLEQELSDGQSA